MRDPGLKAAIAAVGSQAKLGAAFGITAQAVSLWRRVPAERVVDVEKLTGIPRHVLRPDLYSSEETGAEAAA